MSFILSKILWLFLDPAALLFGVLGVGVLLSFFKKRQRVGRIITALAFLGFALAAIVPFGPMLIRPLEARFSFPASLPEKPNGILVLGGFLDPALSVKRGQPVLSGAVERFTAFVELARRYPEAKLIFSGGSGSLTDQSHSEADAARDLAERLGLDPNRVIWESHSRNTHENAIYSRQRAEPKPGETWILVTSAMHMPRAVGCFRRQDFPVIAYPVDYTGDGKIPSLSFDLLGGLGSLSAGLKEWVGLAAYYLMDRTEAFFPPP